MKRINFSQPEFLFCEIPVKDKSYHDNRIWIYHLKSCSLIEFICLEELEDFEFNGVREMFTYEKDGRYESWLGVYVQDQSSLLGFDTYQVLKSAWNYLSEYFRWEDSSSGPMI